MVAAGSGIQGNRVSVAGTEATAGDRGAVGSFRSSDADQPGDDLSVVVCAAARGAARAADRGVCGPVEASTTDASSRPGELFPAPGRQTFPASGIPLPPGRVWVGAGIWRLRPGFGTAQGARLAVRWHRSHSARGPVARGGRTARGPAVRGGAVANHGEPGAVNRHCSRGSRRPGRQWHGPPAHWPGRLRAPPPRTRTASRARVPHPALGIPVGESFKHRGGAKSAQRQ
jgi:hypothetical protein